MQGEQCTNQLVCIKRTVNFYKIDLYNQHLDQEIEYYQHLEPSLAPFPSLPNPTLKITHSR